MIVVTIGYDDIHELGHGIETVTVWCSECHIMIQRLPDGDTLHVGAIVSHLQTSHPERPPSCH